MTISQDQALTMAGKKYLVVSLVGSALVILLANLVSKDTVPGIPDNVLPKIFDPLFTTKQTGTGLGLPSCKNIAEQHSGTISVKNNPTVFTVMLQKNPQIEPKS